MIEDETEVEAFIEREAHIPGFLERVMLADDPIMAQFRLAGGLEGIRKIHQLRQRVVGTYGFSVLTREVVNRLVPYGPFLEVGAGTGYWSYELRRAGCTSIATDIHLRTGSSGGAGSSLPLSAPPLFCGRDSDSSTGGSEGACGEDSPDGMAGGR
jgi:hypothetical protein